jgi:FlaA1/EpsC-like NDP-sugar epimerase
MSWFTLDAITTFAAFGITGVIWRSFGPFHVGWGNAIGLAFGFAVIFSVIGAIVGIQRVEWSRAVAADAFDLIPSVFLAGTAAFFLNYGLSAFPSEMVIVGTIVALVGFAITRYRSRLLTGFASYLLRLRDVSHIARERVLIVGGGDAGQFASWMLGTRGASAFHVVGFVDDDLYKQGVRIRGLNVLGRRRDIPTVVEQRDVGIIVFAIHNISSSERHKLIEICDSTPAQVVMLPDFLGSLNAVTSDMKHETTSFSPGTDDSTVLSMKDFDCWLERLEKSAQNGDLTTVLSDIRLYRKWVRETQQNQEIA